MIVAIPDRVYLLKGPAERFVIKIHVSGVYTCLFVGRQAELHYEVSRGTGCRTGGNCDGKNEQQGIHLVFL